MEHGAVGAQHVPVDRKMKPSWDTLSDEIAKGAQTALTLRAQTSSLRSTSGVPTAWATQEKLPKTRHRRRHTKSRRGCFPCKARKIKCGEELPPCANCVPRGTECSYPEEEKPRSSRSSPSTEPTFVPFVPPNVGPSPHTSSVTFTITEMRFFHHFLTSIQHPLPLGNRAVWIHEIPQLSHQHPFLMHAIIALGAEEMDRSKFPTSPDYDILKHRGRAISGMNKALNETSAWAVYGHPDALLATCYALMYQSSRIADGLKDFQILTDGCSLVTSKIQASRIKTALDVTPQYLGAKIKPGIEYISENLSDMSTARFALSSLEAFGHELNENTPEFCFWQAVYNTTRAFIESPARGYALSILAYSRWYNLSTGLLKGLSEPSNTTAPIVVTLFFANMVFLKVLVPMQTWPGREFRPPLCAFRQIMQWYEVIFDMTSDSQRRHLNWPAYMVEFMSRLCTEDVNSDKGRLDQDRDGKRLILENRETRAHMLLGDVLRIGSDLASWFEDIVTLNQPRQPQN